MAENKNEVLEMGKTAFSIFSFKTKMIIIGVAIGIFLIIIVPVVAMMSIFSNDDKQSNQKNGGSSSSSSTTITVNEVANGMTKYEGAIFPMPFETWNKNQDVVTSKFSKSRTITVNGVTQAKAHTRH